MSDPLVLSDFLTRFQLQLPATPAHPPGGRQAAVLVPVIDTPEPGLLLTLRSSQLRKHAGQVAFPGGMQDTDDRSLIETALREAEEEIALPRRQVKVIGQLPPLTSSSGFHVTPVLGIIPSGLALRPNPEEVESLFVMPLALALETTRYTPLNIRHRGLNHRIWLSWFNQYFIWGLTAGIIRRLSQQVFPSQIS